MTMAIKPSPTIRPTPDVHPPADEEVRGEGPAGDTSAMMSAAIPLLIGLGCLALSLQLPLGTLSAPGPGIWPLICSIAIVLPSIALFLFARKLEHPERFTRNIWAVLLGVASLAGFALWMPIVGVEISLVLLFFLWLKVLGGESWRTSVLVSICATVVVYGLFILALKLQIPHLF